MRQTLDSPNPWSRRPTENPEGVHGGIGKANALFSSSGNAWPDQWWSVGRISRKSTVLVVNWEESTGPTNVCSRDADDGTEFIVLRRALVAYLRAQPPVKNVVPKSVYYIKLPRAYGRPIKQKVVAPPRTDKVKYGAYLAGPLGHCIDCHTPYTDKGMDMTKVGAGGTPFTGPWGVSVARNITPGSLKNWSDAEIAHAIRAAKSRDGTPLKPPMAFDWYKNINDEDMAAIVAYLRSLRPLSFGGAPTAKP